MDIVIVGGGIGGASLGCALAEAGLGVTILEASTEFADRVRGESMAVWGVAEAKALGVDTVLLEAGAHVAASWRTLNEDGSDRGEIPMGLLVEGVPGTLNLAHPVACQALLDAAAAHGADVVRGVGDVTITPGPSPRIDWVVDGVPSGVDTTLIVGADGRGSTVRRQAGLSLERQEPISCIAGLLVEDLHVVDDTRDVLMSDPDQYSLIFHQGGGRARSYLCTGVSGLRRFAGPGGAERFLAACAPSISPDVAALAAATPAGPCATYAGDDTWTDTPYADGVVLVGDSAGHNDPIIGQGLSIAMRDARHVRDLVLDGARTAAAFAAYGEERMERMRRLRLIADVLAVVEAEDADNRTARREVFVEAIGDPAGTLFPLMVGAFAGPEQVPDELVDEGWPDRLRVPSSP
jgi:2-polyprenyl-6-methoxyphenol hydroxylase-like FAD-dependent oxidoreductase